MGLNNENFGDTDRLLLWGSERRLRERVVQQHLQVASVASTAMVETILERGRAQAGALYVSVKEE